MNFSPCIVGLINTACKGEQIGGEEICGNEVDYMVAWMERARSQSALPLKI